MTKCVHRSLTVLTPHCVRTKAREWRFTPANCGSGFRCSEGGRGRMAWEEEVVVDCVARAGRGRRAV